MKLVVCVEVEVFDNKQAVSALDAIALGLNQYGFSRAIVTPLELDDVRVDDDLDPLES